MNAPSSALRSPRSSNALLCGALLCLGLGQIGCGPPEMCQDESPGGFANFRQKTWTPYCADLEDRLRQPLDYDLVSLTEFFAEYPDRASQMQSKLQSFDEPQRCFASKKEQLDYRALNTCLADQEVEGRIQQAWQVRADPWLESYETGVRELSRDMEEAVREGDRVEQKVRQKYQLSASVDEDLIQSYSATLDTLQNKVSTIDRAKDEAERLASASMSYDELNRFIEANSAERIRVMLEDHEKNRFAIAKLRNKERFFKLAQASVGVPCEGGEKATTELKLAKKSLTQQIKDVDAAKPIVITTPTQKTSEEDGAESESFEGYVCAQRGINNQFDGMPKLCAKYFFELKRQKPAGEKKWGGWQVESFNEGEDADGIDCLLIDKP